MVADIPRIIKKGAEQRVNIPDPIRVHIIYLTAWADDDGSQNLSI